MACGSKVEACMFCGELPCRCNAKPAKVKAVKVAKPVAVKAVVVDPAKVKIISAAAPDFSIVTQKPSPFAGMGFVNPTEVLKAAVTSAMQVEVDAVGAAAQAIEPVVRNEKQRYADALKVILDAHIMTPEDQRKIDRLIPKEHNPALDVRVTQWKKRNKS